MNIPQLSARLRAACVRTSTASTFMSTIALCVMLLAVGLVRTPQNGTNHGNEITDVLTENTPFANASFLTEDTGGKIAGVVVNVETGEPIAEATVSLGAKPLTTKTDMRGAYSINVPSGAYTVTITARGFLKAVFRNVIVRDTVVKVNAWLAVGFEPEEPDHTLQRQERLNRFPLPTIHNAPAQPSTELQAEKQEELTRDVDAMSLSTTAPAAPARSHSMQGSVRSTREFAKRKDMGSVSAQVAVPIMPHGCIKPSPTTHLPTTTWSTANTEEYSRRDDNAFLLSKENPLSTFSIDVDNASYSNVRRFLTMHTLPPVDAVRTEEFINYFTYEYPQPKASEPFSVNTEVAECAWNPRHKVVMIGLQGRQIPTAQLPPSNLVFLLDVSGSMDEPNKLPLLKKAVGLMVKELRPQDNVAIVVYAGNAGLVLPPTPGNRKEEILGALERLQAGGSTAGGAGIQLAYRTAHEHFLKEGNNRVILATDGDFNVGVSSDGELVRLIERERQSGVYLTVLGFGMGNYKDSKMEQLADKGNGNYAYIDNIREAHKVMVGQLAGTLYSIANDVKLQVEFNPATVKAYRLIGYENRLLAKEDFNDDRKDAGEMGAGHTVTALYEIVPPEADMPAPSVDPLKYQLNPTSTLPQTTSTPHERYGNELLTVKIRYKEPHQNPTHASSKLLSQPVPNTAQTLARASDNFRFASAVAEFSMLLRDSPFKTNASYKQVLELASRALGADRAGYRAEFLRLVETAQLLSSTQTAMR